MPSSRSQSPDVPTLDEPQSPPIVAAADLDWNPAAESGGDQGAKLIQKVVRRLPSGPGVYRMFDANGVVLYVGKARNLKNRVTSYARTGGHSNRIARMIQQTASMEFVTTHTETEALLLEANLIKRMRPRFNVLMRDDKSFPYIFLKEDHRAPGIFKHRGAHSRKGDYFGPFASAGAVTNTINALQRAFLLRTCADSYYDNRTRPCLLYQIKRCSAPCTGEIGPDEYRLLVDQAKDFLTGKSQAIKAEIAKAMEVASTNMEFERAAMFRDRLTALSHVQGHQDINPQNLDEADIFAIHTDGGLACIQVFFFRTGQNWGNRSYFPRADPTLSASEILGAFLSQFYDGKPVPREILLSHAVDDQAILQEALCLRAGRRVGLTVPQRGEKKQLTDHVLTNVRQAHGRKLAETASQARLLAGFAETFGLARTPRRIEVYDNSHIMGSQAVGAMIVAGPEGFAKNHYRKFNIRSENAAPGDDLAMMHEMIERRFARLIKEEGIPEETGLQEQSDVLPAWPDVILIDGGQGQMSAVREALAGLGLHDTVTAIGVAKGQDRDAGRERFFMDGRQPFSLPPRDPVLYFTQRLRDESHRFAIGSHRARRKRELVRNPLDEIGGIGPARKRALLHSFGTAKAVARASIADLVKVEGISEAMARLVHEHFNQNAES